MLIIIQIWNEHISKILFSSLINEGISKLTKMVLTEFKEKVNLGLQQKHLRKIKVY